MSIKENWSGGPDLIATERARVYKRAKTHLEAATKKIGGAKRDLDNAMRYGFDPLGDVQQSRDVAEIFDALTELNAKLEAIKPTIF